MVWDIRPVFQKTVLNKIWLLSLCTCRIIVNVFFYSSIYLKVVEYEDEQTNNQPETISTVYSPVSFSDLSPDSVYVNYKHNQGSNKTGVEKELNADDQQKDEDLEYSFLQIPSVSATTCLTGDDYEPIWTRIQPQM